MKEEEKKVYSLDQVARSIQRTIAARYQRTYWIKAEMNKLNYYSHSGHAYPELVEKADGKVIAELRAIMWRSTYNKVNANFIKHLGEPLKDGITLVFEASINYHPLHGMSLQIQDVDVSFMLGELEREKKESIERLQKEGLFNLNKKLAFPTIPKRIAIISVETSKGLADFFNIINENAWGYRFEPSLFPALLQGDRSVDSILKQLEQIAAIKEKFDVVTIIRGGGGEVGLSSYNNYFLAKAIAEFPLPVLTGVGHATNETVSEMVAHKNAITPSKLADYLIQHYHNFAVQLEDSELRIQQQVQWRFNQERSRLKDALQSINIEALRLLYQEQNKLQVFTERMQYMPLQHIASQKVSLKNIQQLLTLADPENTLKRGYALVKKQDKIITDLKQLGEEAEFSIQFRDGVLEVERKK